MIKSLSIALGLFIAGTAVLLFAPIYKDVPVDPAWQLPSQGSPAAGALTVRFTGTSTLLFDDGTTQWMLDGWFSRPGPLRMLLGKIEPDLQAIERGLAMNDVDTLAAVIPAHSHYDHAMDAPEVARRTGALLIGSESTANIGRGWGLPESQIRIIEHRKPFTLGDFVITPIETNHFQFADPALRERALGNPAITQPLVPPVAMLDYRLGKAYAFHVQHPKGSFAIVASAGSRQDTFEGLQAGTVFLGIGGLGSQSSAYREAYWADTVERLEADRVIPIHYDSLTGPIEGAFRGPVLVMSFLSSGIEQTLPYLRDKQADNPALRFATLPRYAPVTLFE